MTESIIFIVKNELNDIKTSNMLIFILAIVFVHYKLFVFVRVQEIVSFQTFVAIHAWLIQFFRNFDPIHVFNYVVFLFVPPVK